VPYRTDVENYGVLDRWSTPLELMTRGGDCECYAIAKYALLHETLGVAAELLRLIALAPTPQREAHAVLAVAQGPSFYVLDNRTPAILRSDRIGDAEPVYGVNEACQFTYAATS
jgi:predicted transglutaminase-like cysteine proteinase